MNLEEKNIFSNIAIGGNSAAWVTEENVSKTTKLGWMCRAPNLCYISFVRVKKVCS
jgi:hypothetical protein